MSVIGGGLVLVFVVLVFAGVPWLLLRSRSETLARVVEFAAVASIVLVGLFVVIDLVNSLALDRTQVTVPLTPRVPKVDIPGLVLGPPPATILDAGQGAATFTISGLTWAPRLLLAATTLIQAAVMVFLALLVFRLAGNVRGGRPFGGLSRMFVQGGGLLFAGYLLWSILGSVGSALAGDQALGIHQASYTGTNPLVDQAFLNGDYVSLGWPEPAMWGVWLESWPVGVAFALVLASAAFAAGERMQDDTEGLV